jgi:ABC-type glycerol-3-phosphate transport system substrate-binding protein
MKKSFVLLLAVVFLASLVLVGCGGETTTTMAPETTTTMAPETTTTMASETTTTMAPETTTTAAPVATIIPWNEAINHEGETGTVTGPVVAVEDMGAGIDKYILRIGSEGDDGFNATVEYPNADKFGGADGLKALVGKTVAVTGDIYDNAFELKAEILLTDPAQLVVATM